MAAVPRAGEALQECGEWNQAGINVWTSAGKREAVGWDEKH